MSICADRKQHFGKIFKKGLYKAEKWDYNNIDFGLVARIEAQAGQLYAPRFGGVNRMVATRFTSARFTCSYERARKSKIFTAAIALRAMSAERLIKSASPNRTA